MRDFYIEQLDDYVYSKEMLQKGHILVEEVTLNEKWQERMLEEIETIEKDLEEEKVKKDKEIEKVHSQLEELIEVLRKQENVLSNALHIQEYERCLIDLQENIIRGNDIHDSLIQLVINSSILLFIAK